LLSGLACCYVVVHGCFRLIVIEIVNRALTKASDKHKSVSYRARDMLVVARSVNISLALMHV